jgi:hypothetical protein
MTYKLPLTSAGDKGEMIVRNTTKKYSIYLCILLDQIGWKTLIYTEEMTLNNCSR